MTMTLATWPWLVAETGRYWLPDQNAYTDTPPERFGRVETEAKLTDFLSKIGKPGPSLAYLKAQLRDRVDADAEAQRMKYISPGAGMAMTYAEKKDQAIAVLSMGQAAANALANHGAAEFPTLSASVPVEAADLYAAAQLVMQKYEAFAAISRGIEAKRLAGKKAIRDASDAAAAQAAYEAITWTA